MKSVIIIGGGIAGCSTAYAFAQRGARVTIVERHEKLAQEASGNPIAILYPKLSVKPTAQTALQLQGFEYVVNLLKKLSTKNKLFESCGLIQLAYNARESAKQTDLMLQGSLQLLDAQQTSEKAGITLNLGGLYFPQAGWVNPASFCELLCNSPNITKITSTEAINIEKTKNGLQVLLHDNHKLQADIVVICCANEAKKFNQCASLQITPIRGQVNFFAKNAVSEKLKAIVSTDHFISPAVNGLHSFGTSYAPNDLQEQVSETDTYSNLQALRKIYPALFELIKSTTGRVAWRSQTLDYMPLAGQLLCEDSIRNNPPRYNSNSSDLPWLDGLFVNAGHGSKGMITAPICGELIASLAYQNAPFIDANLASKLNPSRFLLRELGLKQLSQTLYR